ncbi:MAG: hypothetical protein LBL65_04185, partial [Campylobacteraceae bacterium]|nr:hypothetical protein [Campylobacteraceae bacterium]
MNSIVKVLTVLLFILTLTGCSSSNNNSDDTQTVKNPYSYGYSCEEEITVNGYTLPPCPAPKLNDSTLLGIDSNNNGVRDDVERWLIVKYKNHHRIVTEIGFQTAKAAQEIVKSNPS